LHLGVNLTGLKISGNTVLVSGGGGESKTGVPNIVVGFEWGGEVLPEEVEKYDCGRVTFTDIDVFEDLFVGCSVDNCSTFRYNGKEVVKEFDFPLEKSEFMQRSARFSPGGRLAIAASNGYIGIWEKGEEFELVKFLFVSDGERDLGEDLSRIEWIGEDKMAVLKKTVLEIWDVQKVEFIGELRCRSGSRFNGLRVSKNLKYICLIQFEPRVASYLTKYDISNGRERSVLIHRGIHATCLSISSDSQFIAMGDAKGSILVCKQNLSLLMKKKFTISSSQISN